MKTAEKLNNIVQTILDNGNSMPQSELQKKLKYDDMDELISDLTQDGIIHFYGSPGQPLYVKSKGKMLMEDGGYKAKK